jgi:2-alkyl-3-oxoalkanoate reductase
MIVFLTGATGVLGRATVPLLTAAGHDARTPSHRELDLFDPRAVRRAVRGADAVMHLATRIPSPAVAADGSAWAENDRLRRDASRLLVEACLDDPGVGLYVQPSLAFISAGCPDESTTTSQVADPLRSAVEAERQARRLTAAGRRGVVLRFGLLYGPGAASPGPDPRFSVTLSVQDAGAALLASLRSPAGVYDVVDDGSPISHAEYTRVTGWRPGPSPARESASLVGY